jgi:hypothetical protein
MGLQGRGQKGMGETAIDPVALLKREHEMILDQLRMIETIIGPRGAKADTLPQPDGDTLRELFRFFTNRVGVHFKREAVLIAALSGALRRKREERKQFDGLAEEHRALKADAAGIMKQLNGKPFVVRRSRSSAQNLELRTLNSQIRAFVRRYHGHLSCEERILYVLAQMRLTDEQKLQVSRRMLQV